MGRGIFSREGLDRANHVESAYEIALRAQAQAPGQFPETGPAVAPIRAFTGLLFVFRLRYPCVLSVGFQGRSMRNRADYILKLKPWSLSAFMAAFLAVVFAATMQEVLASFGATLHFAAFFPAILMASLLGGAPAGIFAAVLAIPIVWWAFMPPIFEFNPLTHADYDSFAIFVLCSSLLICFSHLYREALAIRMKFPGESDLTGRLPN
jgi:hypothetical protein